MLAWIAGLALGSAAVLFLGAAMLRRRAGLPAGRVIWDDEHGRRGLISEPLYDQRTGLAGRPDYLLRHGRELILVEVKSRTAPPSPYPGHILQAGAYCLLVQAVLGRRPSMALLRYSDRSFRVPYTRELEASVSRASARVLSFQAAVPDRSHSSRARCRACGFLDQCDQALA